VTNGERDEIRRQRIGRREPDDLERASSSLSATTRVFETATTSRGTRSVNCHGT
jgi:hypothetical protein